MVKNTPSFPDHNQNFWQLASIQSASQAIPGILAGGVLTQQYGAKIAFTSICMGNLLLWLIGLGITSMAIKDRKNVIQVAEEYLGRGFGTLVAVILIMAFTFWYIIDLQGVIDILRPVFPATWNWGFVGFSLGSMIALLSIGGICLIKRACIWSLPVLFFILIYGIVYFGHFPEESNWGVSFSGIMVIVFLYLPGFVNLSTFFRHSNSKADSILALSLITIFVIIFQTSTIFIGISKFSSLLASNSISVYFLAFSFALISFFCVNLVNIYFASAGIEAIFPRFVSPQRYFWIGLGGTISYFFYRHSSEGNFLESFVSNCIMNLGVILLLAFLVETMIGKRPKKINKITNAFCWIVGCLTAYLSQEYELKNANIAFIKGVCSITVSFLIVLFIERCISVIRKLKSITVNLE